MSGRKKQAICRQLFCGKLCQCGCGAIKKCRPDGRADEGTGRNSGEKEKLSDGRTNDRECGVRLFGLLYRLYFCAAGALRANFRLCFCGYSFDALCVLSEYYFPDGDVMGTSSDYAFSG